MAKLPEPKDPGERLTNLVLNRPSVPATQPPKAGEEPEPRETAEETDSHRAELPVTRERAAEAPEGAVAREEPDKSKAVKKFKIDGVEYTPQDLIDKGLIEGIVTSAGKFTTVQRKYVELLEKDRVAIDAPARTAAEGKQLTPREIFAKVRQVYAPVIEAIIKADIEEGLIEPDAVEIYPNLLRNAYTRIFYQEDRIMELMDRVTGLVNFTNGLIGQNNQNALRQAVDGHLDKLQGKGELYALLKDGKVREGFMGFLAELDPKREQIDGDKAEEYLSRQWIAYNADAIAEAGAIPGKTVDDDRRLAAGERGGGGRPVLQPKKEESLEDRLDATSGVKFRN